MTHEYRKLLDECLFPLNQLPRQRIPDGDGGDTYKLASKIETELKKQDDRNNRLFGVLTTAGTDVATDETRVIINVSKEQLIAAGSMLYKTCVVTILDVIPASA
jgi:hypothetical protein